MKKFKAAFVNNAGDRMVNYVYSPEQIKKLEEITDFIPGIFSNEDVKAGKLKDVEVLFSTWGMPALTDEEIAEMPKLQALFYGAGATDTFAHGFFRNNIRLFSAWQANAVPVAEFCVAQILLGLKSYFRCSRELVEPDKWNHKFAGPGVYGATVALIGAGAISSKVQELLKNFSVEVIVVPSRKENRTISLEEAFARAAVVSNHLPDRDDNVGVLDGKLFRSMKEGALFINTGRGRQVNEADLVEVMRERPDLTALLDVTFPEPPEKDSPLYTTPNIRLSPHIAGSLNDEVHRMADFMIEEYCRFASGEETRYEVKPSMLLTSK